MAFRDLDNIAYDYNSVIDNIAVDFYIPVLSNAIEYKRAVGYFSSNMLVQLAKGLCSFCIRKGKIKLLICPELSKEDYDAIENGYSKREMAENKIKQNFNIDDFNEEQKNRLGLLAYLIQTGVLDIKIVVMNRKHFETSEAGIFHMKEGIATDENGDKISFGGSNNSTFAAINNNLESFDVFCSWKSDESLNRCSLKEIRFDNLWNSTFSKNVEVIPFPEIIKEKLLTFMPKTQENKEMIFNLDKYLKLKQYAKRARKHSAEPEEGKVNPREYQINAYENWKKANFRGIYDMATGTGKTITGLYSLANLYKEKKRLFAIIVCPYMHLVDQWADEARIWYNLNPIICHSDIYNWKIQYKNEIQNFYLEKTNFACVITTNATFTSDYFQKYIEDVLPDTLLVVDEAHNFGSEKISECMKINYPYRLGLSATIERYGDEEGTQKLFDFFGKPCITFTLEEAIRKGFLTPYKYYPILVSLNSEEVEQYDKLTEEISKCVFIGKNSKSTITDKGKRLLLKRARLIAGAKSKIEALKNEIYKYRNDSNILIYCGAVRYGEDDYEKAFEDKKQIEIVVKMLYDTYGIIASKFTAEEDSERRAQIKQGFIEGNLKALVAIKCLDEGMNIPAIKTAFILASSTNPKEYIQRRGRVLRKYPGKQYAEIYDFITITRPLNEMNKISDKQIKLESGLAKKELVRMMDFASLSLNPSYSNDIKDAIMEAFNLDKIDLGGDYE